jgi:hypothetical protein
MTKKSSKSEKIQVTVDRYTLHVIEKLIHIKGTSAADVANFILKDWIGDHFAELEKYKITVQVKNGRLVL